MNEAENHDTTPAPVTSIPSALWVDPVGLAIDAAVKQRPASDGVFSGRWVNHDGIEIVDRGNGDIDLKAGGMRLLVRDFGVAIEPGRVDADGLVWLNDDAVRSLARALRSIGDALGVTQAPGMA